jgi:lysophospholipase L1-like esterase
MSARLQHILVYSDSASWGIIPETRRRLPFEARWPGALELELAAASDPADSASPHTAPPVRVIENCLNGRRTAWEDPFKPGRNGLVGFEQVLEINAPLALLILMLGTNDFQSVHALSPWHSAQGIAALVHAARRAPIEPGMKAPPVLIVAPPRSEQARGAMAAKFSGAGEKSRGLAAAFEAVAVELGCAFFDASTVTGPSRIDGVHLDADQHLALARALGAYITRLKLLEPGA